MKWYTTMWWTSIIHRSNSVINTGAQSSTRSWNITNKWPVSPVDIKLVFRKIQLLACLPDLSKLTSHFSFGALNGYIPLFFIFLYIFSNYMDLKPNLDVVLHYSLNCTLRKILLFFHIARNLQNKYKCLSDLFKRTHKVG